MIQAATPSQKVHRAPSQLARLTAGKKSPCKAGTDVDTGAAADSEYMDDLRIEAYEALTPPELLSRVLPLSAESKRVIGRARADVVRVLKSASASDAASAIASASTIASGSASAGVSAGASASARAGVNSSGITDDRLVVIVGPCSIHDVGAALEYGARLQPLVERLRSQLVIIMRVYFEKPRTVVGWKGLINDPFLDGSFRINDGLHIARQLLCDLTGRLGVPVGCELLDTISPQFIGDVISWGAIGARTTESQLHRELASGVSFPVGFKNGTNGAVDIAVDAIRSAASPHRFLGVNHVGLAAITKTSGNDTCHVILRGGKTGPNYDAEHVRAVKETLAAHKLPEKIMVDCSHGNSLKDFRNQRKVVRSLCEQIAGGEYALFGVMIESNLMEGNQKIPDDLATLQYGCSVTDACVGWEETVEMLEELSAAVLQRRQRSSVAGK